jgi:hypothetical protein
MIPSASFRRRARRVLGAAALLLVLLACGDGSFLIIFNSGTIVRGPVCEPGGGRFDIRDQGGLLVLVVIDSETDIFLSSGSIGTCSDLAVGAVVEVSGTGDGERITADEVRVQ